MSPSNEHPGLISFRMDWLDLLAVQGTLKRLLQHHNLKVPILQLSVFFMVQLSHPHMMTGKTIALTRWTLLAKWCLCFLIPYLGLSLTCKFFWPLLNALHIRWGPLHADWWNLSVSHTCNLWEVFCLWFSGHSLPDLVEFLSTLAQMGIQPETQGNLHVDSRPLSLCLPPFVFLVLPFLCFIHHSTAEDR